VEKKKKKKMENERKRKPNKFQKLQISCRIGTLVEDQTGGSGQ
jgi:hypothetical protein